MTRINRQTFVSLCRVFLLALLVLVLLLLLGGALLEMLRKGLPPIVALRAAPYILADAVWHSIPVALLYAIVVVYSRLVVDNELLAAGSLGIPPWRLMVPGVLFGALWCLPTLWILDYSISWGQNGVLRVVLESIDDIAYSTLRSQGRYVGKQCAILAKDVSGHTLIKPTLMLSGSDSRPVTVVASQAELRTDPGGNVLSVMLYDGRIDLGNGTQIRFPDIFEQRILLPQAAQFDINLNFSLAEIPREVARIRALIKRLEREVAAMATDPALREGKAGDVAKLSAADEELARSRKQLYKLVRKPYRRWAHGMSCLSFAAIGIAVATRMKTSSTAVILFAGMFPVLMVYQPLEMFLASRMNMPPIAIWIPNLLLADAALILLYRHIRR